MKTTVKKPSKTAAANRAYELGVINNAAYFTAFVQLNPFDRRRIEAPTQEGAIAAGVTLANATGKRLALIYAVDPDGHDTPVGTVDRAGVFKSAVTPA